MRAVGLPLYCYAFTAGASAAFVVHKQNAHRISYPVKRRQICKHYMVYAPPGSGYFTPEDEGDPMPPDYMPVMEYPGTMRPAHTRENVPYEDLPIDEDGPPPVPWPHFQEIPYHHVWGSPHEDAPLSINQFIDDMGRWATLEEEAETIRQTRRAMRDAKAAEKQQAKEDMVVMDDDLEDDDEDEGKDDELLSLKSSASVAAAPKEDVSSADLEEDGDFLLEELGLDLDEGYDSSSTPAADLPKSSIEKTPITEPDTVVVPDDDFDFDLGLDDDDEEETVLNAENLNLVDDGEGAAVDGSDHKGKVDPIVPDDYEKSNENMDDFDGYNDDKDVYTEEDDDDLELYDV